MSLDHCPECGRRITDTDDNGHEASNGQRWCRDHLTGPAAVEAAIEAVADLRDSDDADVARLLTTLDFVAREYRFMCHSFDVATRPGTARERKQARAEGREMAP